MFGSTVQADSKNSGTPDILKSISTDANAVMTVKQKQSARGEYFDTKKEALNFCKNNANKCDVLGKSRNRPGKWLVIDDKHWWQGGDDYYAY